ncbi:hypothetical protein ACFE04_030932 [Oxalis oulophora]
MPLRRELTPPKRRPKNPRPPPRRRGAQAERVAPPERVARAPRLVQAEENLSTRSNNATEMNVESDESVQLPPNVDVRATNVPHVAPLALNGAYILSIVLQAMEARKELKIKTRRLSNRMLGANITFKT